MFYVLLKKKQKQTKKFFFFSAQNIHPQQQDKLENRIIELEAAVLRLQEKVNNVSIFSFYFFDVFFGFFLYVYVICMCILDNKQYEEINTYCERQKKVNVLKSCKNNIIISGYPFRDFKG